MYWASACGGCEISLLDTGQHFLELTEHFQLVFCPCLVDAKKKDIEELPDGAISVTFFNGSVRNSENEAMARLLRRKSRMLVAYGSCAHEGCVTGLSNLSSLSGHFDAVYLDNPSTNNVIKVAPCGKAKVPEGDLELPGFSDTVKPLSLIVEVDYTIPGCPPEPGSIMTATELIMRGELPPKGSVMGGGPSIVCRQCPRKREEKKIGRIFRTFEIVPEDGSCLLDQGIICMGIVTREGCGAPCPAANMPCTGCYGPAEGIADQGAKMVSAIGTVLDPGETKGFSEAEIAAKIDAIIDDIHDYTGTFYKYSLAGSILRKAFRR